MRLYVLVRYDGTWDVYNLWNTLYQSHPHSYYQVKPNGHFRIFGGKYVVDTDSHGFRSSEMSTVKAEATRVGISRSSTRGRRVTRRWKA